MRQKIVISIIALLLLFGGIAFADEKEKPNPTGTIVGSELMQNRYEYVDPSEEPKERPPVVQELLDKGVFTAVEDARQGAQPVVTNQKKN